MKIVFVSCTRKALKEETLLGQTFVQQAARTSRDAELKLITNNSNKLSAVYNSFITEKYKDHYIVFTHDDISFNVQACVYELHDAFEKADIIGLAGCTEAEVKSPALWHIMGRRGHLSGAVAHPNGNTETIFMTSFGPYPQRCLMMDGLFLGVNVDKLLETGVKFDESNPSIAHFYDLDFCLSANAASIKMTTWPIYVCHRSPGLLSIEDKQWKVGERWFLNKWSPKINLFK